MTTQAARRAARQAAERNAVEMYEILATIVEDERDMIENGQKRTFKPSFLARIEAIVDPIADLDN